MSNVVALGRVAAGNEPVQEVIDVLEMMLARAKAGELRAFAYAHIDGGGYGTTGWVIGTVDAGVLVGAVTRLHYKLNKAWDEAPSVDDQHA
jgi:hypothetical protein